SALELNVDWLVCLGLLLPPLLSGPFLLIKPQNAFGIWLTFSRKILIYSGLVLLGVIAVSLLLWQGWPLQALKAYQTIVAGQSYNLAPVAIISPLASLPVGAVLAWRAFKRRDPILAILAWLFFVPYIALYSLLLHFAVFAIRYPRIALIISVVMWIIYG